MKKMQEKYEIPQMEVVEFESEDIITASNPYFETDELPMIPAMQLEKREAGIKPRILVFWKISRKEW